MPLNKREIAEVSTLSRELARGIAKLLLEPIDTGELAGRHRSNEIDNAIERPTSRLRRFLGDPLHCH